MNKTRRRNKKRIKDLKRCRACEDNTGQRRRQLTAYCDDSRNFEVFCHECQKYEDEYWEGMWKEYYSGCL